jgi:hypothetical protein
MKDGMYSLRSLAAAETSGFFGCAGGMLGGWIVVWRVAATAVVQQSRRAGRGGDVETMLR